MLIEKNKVVTFHYILTETDKELIEDSHDGDAVVFLHGYNGMLKSLEEAMVGKQKNDKFSLSLSADQAYGPLQQNAHQRVSIKHIIKSSKKKVKYKPGMVVQINTTDGPREVVVIKVGLKNIDVDANHPLAGKALTFEVEIIDIRDASKEEIAHGHVHGVGGHQH